MTARRRPPQRAAAVAIPVAPRTAWRLILGGFLLVGGAAAILWAVAAGLPGRAAMSVATATSEAGFVVRQVDIQGARNQPKLSVYREVLEGGSDSMLLVDLAAMRERLVALPWVRDASIQRRWPDRLEVRLVERQPAALWQVNGRLNLIDAQGALLPAEDLSGYGQLPLLVGAGARSEAAGLLRLVAAQPVLAGEMKAALWVGKRRWDLRMKSGETISLPEGAAAEAALLRFADIHRETPLLGRGFVRFDLRLPDKMVVRVGGEPGQLARPRPVPLETVPRETVPREPVPRQTAPTGVGPGGAQAVRPDDPRPQAQALQTVRAVPATEEGVI